MWHGSIIWMLFSLKSDWGQDQGKRWLWLCSGAGTKLATLRTLARRSHKQKKIKNTRNANVATMINGIITVYHCIPIRWLLSISQLSRFAELSKSPRSNSTDLHCTALPPASQDVAWPDPMPPVLKSRRCPPWQRHLPDQGRRRCDSPKCWP